MPFTLSHIAVVVPITWAGTRWLLPSALAIGCMMPDFEHVLGLTVPGSANSSRPYTHSMRGILTFCLPLGVVAMVAYHLVLKRALLWLLPQGHRLRLAPYAARIPLSIRTVVATVLSILLGAWTHIAVDAITHGGYTSYYLGLNYVLFNLPDYPVTIFRALQVIFSGAGLLFLVAWYWRWYRAQPEPQPVAEEFRASLGRFLAIAMLVVLPCVAAISLEWKLILLRLHPETAQQVVSLVYAITVRWMGMFTLCLLLYSSLYLLVTHELRRTRVGR